MILKKYSNLPEEASSLATICERWTFWSFSEVTSLLDRSPRSCLYYLTGDGNWLGLALWGTGGDGADLLYLYVLPENRRQKLGKKILLDSLNQLSKQGIKHLFLEVRTTNTAAIALYQSMGMEIVGSRKNYYSNGDDAHTMAGEIEQMGSGQ